MKWYLIFSLSILLALPAWTADININIGGSAYTAQDGTQFSPDAKYKPGQSGYIGGNLSISTGRIAGHDDDKLFQSGRWGFQQYKFQVPPGLYQVKLYFAETFFKAPLKRVFDLKINGKPLIKDLDIFDRVGNHRALILQRVVRAGKDGIIIKPVVHRDAALLSAVSIIKTDTPEPLLPKISQCPGNSVDIHGAAFKPYNATTGSGYIGGRVLTINNEKYCQGFREYRIQLQPGIYDVVISFSEPLKKRANTRRFTLTLNGRRILENFDILKSAGEPNRLIKRRFITAAPNGNINIAAREISGYSLIAGIKISPFKGKLSPPPAPVSCRVDNREDRLFITWPRTDDFTIIGFNVYRSEKNGSSEKINLRPVGREMFCDKNIKLNHSYSYRIAAVNAAGIESKLSPSTVVTISKLTDDQFMDMIQRACFKYFWNEADQQTGLVKDSSKSLHSSVAATGFGLTAMVIAAERNYHDRHEIEQRVLAILQTTGKSKTLHGMHYHFIELDGSHSKTGYEDITSTIDTALLLMGVITAGEYFGGKIREQAEAIVAQVNWKKYQLPDAKTISMGWDPGKNEPLKYAWNYYTDEAILCSLLAVAAPRTEYQLPPTCFYRWKREGKDFISSWCGALFTYQFAHCWIDFKSLGHDMPAKFGLKNIKSADWFENSRTATLNARKYCLKRQDKFNTFTPDSWGLTACDSPGGYYVGGSTPRGNPAPPATQGVIAPYGAGSAMVLTPEKSMKALRHYYNLRDKNGKRLVWKDEYYASEYGFRDSFDLDRNYVADKYIGIDQGPLMLALENYRTGLVWKYFMRNPHIKNALQRIGFSKQSE
jgi:hypothetical protein